MIDIAKFLSRFLPHTEGRGVPKECVVVGGEGVGGNFDAAVSLQLIQYVKVTRLDVMTGLLLTSPAQPCSPFFWLFVVVCSWELGLSTHRNTGRVET